MNENYEYELINTLKAIEKNQDEILNKQDILIAQNKSNFNNRNINTFWIVIIFIVVMFIFSCFLLHITGIKDFTIFRMLLDN